MSYGYPWYLLTKERKVFQHYFPRQQVGRDYISVLLTPQAEIKSSRAGVYMHRVLLGVCQCQPETGTYETSQSGAGVMTSQKIAPSQDPVPKVSQSASLASFGSSTISKKRKSSPQIKYYAVKLGHTPGIYLDWKECEQNVTGFKNAAFKSFSTLGEAEDYVAGREISTRLGSSSGIEKFYGVAKGRIPGVYTEWAAAQAQIKGWKGPKYKKFGSRSEAEAFVRDNSDINKISALPAGNTEIGDALTLMDRECSGDDVEKAHIMKKAKVTLLTQVSPHDRALDQDSERQDNNTSSMILTGAGTGSQAGILRIHTDGSSLANGKDGARAGVGVYFGMGDPRNISERLPGALQTNQRAELAAILRALEIAPKNREVHIVTDSEYGINCATAWYKKWERNDWQTSDRKPVLNKDLIQGILEKIKDREALGITTRFFWVKGHSKDPGNDAADRLANLGAHKPRIE